MSYCLAQRGGGEVSVRAWGAGAGELIESVPDLLGGRDDPESFLALDERVAVAHRRLRGLRVPRTGRVLEALVPAVLEQRIVGVDAFAHWRRLVTRYGEVAPGPAPAGMKVIPATEVWQSIPTWEWHRAGVEQRKARTIALAASYASRLEAAAREGDNGEVYRMLRAVPGIGVWTAHEVGARALGDADAAPIGDYHLPALLGEALGDGHAIAESAVEEFLEPWRPHRYRLVRVLELTPGSRRERRGPRMSRLDYRAI